MTRLGRWSLLAGAVLLTIGLLTAWQPVAVLGAGILAVVAGSAAYVAHRPRIRLERAVEPPRVEKGKPAIAVIHATNVGRRPLPGLRMEQRLGGHAIEARLPRLRRGASGLRTYRLPTTVRGVFELGPVELPRADPFGLCRTVQSMGRPQMISVHPRLLRLQPLPTGVSRYLEGPSSDLSPQGTVTFHRLREYVVGDDLRTVHWPSTAKAGQLVVRHNVDTAQPYTVVLLDLDPAGYSPEAFEEAVDTTASVAMSMASGKSPVQVRTTSGDRLGGSAYRDPTAIVDHLTEVEPNPSGSLQSELVLLRRDRGGTALVVVTGRLDASTLPAAAALRRRFDRVIVLSLVDRPGRVPVQSGVTVLQSSSVEEVALQWNSGPAR